MNKQIRTVGIVGTQHAQKVYEHMQHVLPKHFHLFCIDDNQSLFWNYQCDIMVMTDLDLDCVPNTYVHWTTYLDAYRRCIAQQKHDSVIVYDSTNKDLEKSMREAPCRTLGLVPEQSSRLPVVMTHGVINALMTVPVVT